MTEAKGAFGSSGGRARPRASIFTRFVVVAGIALVLAVGEGAAMMLPVQGTQPKAADGANPGAQPPADPTPSIEGRKGQETPSEPSQRRPHQGPSGPGCQDQGTDLDLIV
ncbi:MAG: hypothetical protein GC150_16550 [Rhizobiales bacterium]|nr:hypothetical protein [Hyphomicrobiales bacterium]